MLADATSLEHRFPRLWARVQALEVPVWTARRITGWCGELSQDQAGWVDWQLDDRPIGGWTLARVHRLVDGLCAIAAPQLAAQKIAAARDRRRVWVGPADPDLTCEVWARLDALDARQLNHTIGQLARLLADPANLGPLSRTVHRAKTLSAGTRAGWQLHQPSPGIYHWTSPLGYRYRVDPIGGNAIPVNKEE